MAKTIREMTDKIDEIASGDLSNPNIPDFSNPRHECDCDGYPIMSCEFKGYHVLGILDQNNIPMSYLLIEPTHTELKRFVEIYTDPSHRNKNLAATLLMSLKKLDIKLVINSKDIISDNGRKLLLSMSKNGRLMPSLPNGIKLSYEELEKIFKIKHANNYSIIFEGFPFMNQERKYRKDELLSEWWRLRGEENTKRELYED